MDKIQLAFNKLKEAHLENRYETFIEYCDECISEKETGNIREEEAAYSICGSISINGLSSIPKIEAVIDCACDMEIPRESSYGAGISINDTWIKEKADEYKQKQWKELLEVIEEAKSVL